ncbi:MAG: type 1 glutamine amidotransferase [Xanthomonadaceae bacterium]|nr:type 1 glutamine amidotransferase [Xanthomonadaceae bacterium]
MKVLIVDCTRDSESWGAEDFRRILSQIMPGLEIHVRRAPEEDLPSHSINFDRIFITGSRTSCVEESTWVTALLDYLRIKIEMMTPVLGVCFGHQIISRVFGGKTTLRESQVPEYGWTKVEVLAESSLFKGMPKTFYSLSSHSEEVDSLAQGLRLLAKSKDCSIQAFESDDHPVFGIQFHPEKDLASAESTYLSLKKSKKHHLFQNRNKSKKVYDPKTGEKLFLNFLNYEKP